LDLRLLLRQRWLRGNDKEKEDNVCGCSVKLGL
jgi:hypothetical protein